MAVNMVKLMSSDQKLFEVDAEVADQSVTVKDMIEDTGMDAPIPLPNVSANILAKVIEYCKFHLEAEKSVKPKEDIKSWDADFMAVDQSTLFELILAANYLNIKPLLDETCKTVANMIKGKSPEEIREMFGIVNDFTADEEAEVRRENQWAFE